MKKFIALFAAVTFLGVSAASANRTVYKNRFMIPYRLQSAPVYPDIQTFTATGTWYKPPGVEYVLVIIAGGGGSGGGGRVASGGNDGGSGGEGGECKTEIVDVRGTSSETVTIGTGGAAPAARIIGNVGVASSFGALITAAGGAAGPTAAQTSDMGITSGQGHTGGGPGRAQQGSGLDGAYGSGGVSAGGADSGGGGGGSYGAGGAASDAGAGTAAAANTGGGGGGGAVDAAGGAGGSGICIVISLPKTFTLP